MSARGKSAGVRCGGQKSDHHTLLSAMHDLSFNVSPASDLEEGTDLSQSLREINGKEEDDSNKETGGKGGNDEEDENDGKSATNGKDGKNPEKQAGSELHPVKEATDAVQPVTETRERKAGDPQSASDDAGGGGGVVR